MEGHIFNLPRLEALNLSSNKLSRLNRKILSNVGDLRHLDVSHNGITKVEKDSLASVGNLHFLNISFNNIREFEARTFAGLSRDAIQCCRAKFSPRITLC